MSPTAAVEVTLNTLIGDDTDKSIREIASDEATTAVAKVVDGAPEAFDTLKEIADWIQNNPGVSTIPDLTNRLTKVENTLGDGTTDGLIKTVNDLSTDVSGIKTTLFGDNSTVGLTTTVSNLNTIVNSHTTQIKEMSESLSW